MFEDVRNFVRRYAKLCPKMCETTSEDVQNFVRRYAKLCPNMCETTSEDK